MLLVPGDDDIKVQNLKFGEFVREKGSSTFSVNFTWTEPVFNFTFRSYDIVYELSGYTADKPIIRINAVWQLSFML